MPRPISGPLLGSAGRGPSRPSGNPAERVLRNPRTPRELLAVELREQILSGAYPVGTDLPGIKGIGLACGIAPSTVHRAYALLREWGLVETAEGGRARVLPLAPSSTDSAEIRALDPEPDGRGMIRLDIRLRGESVASLLSNADPSDGRALRRLLLDAISRRGEDKSAIGDYEMSIVTAAGERLGIFVAPSV